MGTTGSSRQLDPWLRSLESAGLALAMSWFGLLLWSPCVSALSSLPLGEPSQHLARLVFLLAICAVYALAHAFPRLLASRRRMTAALALASVASTPCLLPALVPSLRPLIATHLLIPLLAWALAGASVALAMLIWGYKASVKKTDKGGGVSVASGCIISGILFLVVGYLQPPVAAALVIALPYLMLALWLAFSSGIGHTQEAEKTPWPSNPATLETGVQRVFGVHTPLFIWAYGFLMGLTGSLSTGAELAPLSVLFIAIPRIAAGSVMVIVLQTGRRPRNEAFLLFLPFAILYFFSFPLLPTLGRALLMGAVFFLVDALNIVNTAEGAQDAAAGLATGTETGADRDIFGHESRTADMVGSALGWLCGIVILFVLPEEAQTVAFFLVAVVYVCLFTATGLSGGQGTPAQATPAPLPTPHEYLALWQQTCQEISEEYGLSKREAEILEYLSRGRDRQYIHETLGIASSTVRTHAHNVFKKLGIHTRQELITLVEDAFMKR